MKLIQALSGTRLWEAMLLPPRGGVNSVAAARATVECLD